MLLKKDKTVQRIHKAMAKPEKKISSYLKFLMLARFLLHFMFNGRLMSISSLVSFQPLTFLGNPDIS